mgnify:FL=1
MYASLAALLAAGCDGLERTLALPPRADGDQYSNPGQAPGLPATMDAALAAFESSPLASMLGERFSENVAVLARYEHALAADHLSGDPDEVTVWERQRYLEHT